MSLRPGNICDVQALTTLLSFYLNPSAGGGARDSRQRLLVLRAGVGPGAVAGRADGGDGYESQGGRAPGRCHDPAAGAGGQRAAEAGERPERARPIRRPHPLRQGQLRAQFHNLLSQSQQDDIYVFQFTLHPRHSPSSPAIHLPETGLRCR